MGIEIKEEFEIEAPVERVWEFVMTPEKIVPCIPGATLVEVVDDRNLLGKVKVKLGAVSAAFKGKIHYADIDADKHVLRMVAEGKDPSGGTVKGSITCSLSTLEGGSATQFTIDANFDITGKIMQVGRGMIEGVSRQLFMQFSKNIKARLQAEIDAAAPTSATGSESSGSNASDASTSTPAATSAPSPAVAEEAELKVLPLLMKALAAAISNFFKRIFGGAK